MFSSINTSFNPFLPFSFHNHHNHLLQYPLSTSISHYSSNTFDQHHRLPLGQFTSSSMNINTVTPEDDVTMAKIVKNLQENMVDKSANGEGNDAHVLVSSNKVSVKSGRHSKIFTAQGLRDRRVRLSIGIAREFFDLQDLLGFDKASKTLEWLLIKSQTAINELSSSFPTNQCPNEGCNKCLPSIMDCGKISISAEANSGNGDPRMASVTKSFASEDKMIKKSSCKTPMQSLSKESRQKARARARARTREKLCNKKEFDEPKKFCEGTSSGKCKQLEGKLRHRHKDSMISSLKVISSEIEEPIFSHPIVNDRVTSRKDFTESSMIKPSSFFNPPDPLVSNGISSNNIHLPRLGQYWDLSDPTTRSSFGASMNLSTEVQIYGEPWDIFNSHQNL